MWTGKNLLIAAKERIAHNWIARFMAANSVGIPCHMDTADCWCAVGVLHYLCPTYKDVRWQYDSLMPAAKEAVQALFLTMEPSKPWPSRTDNTEIVTELTQYNDKFYTSIKRPVKMDAPQGVLDWFDRAIALLKDKENG